MIAGFTSLIKYWLPAPVDREALAPKLARFYADRSEYHAMTANDNKLGYPQVRLLLKTIAATDRVVEFGCGGGVVLQAAGKLAAEAIGFDIGEIPIAKANSRPGKHRAVTADAAHVPLSSNYADIVYSFEVLEHVWDPAAVIREMIRVAKPGGLVYFTTPNGYAMNLHLPLRKTVRLIHHVGAAINLFLSELRAEPFQNIPPDLDANPVYPDCDMITRLHPRSLEGFARKSGCPRHAWKHCSSSGLIRKLKPKSVVMSNSKSTRFITGMETISFSRASRQSTLNDPRSSADSAAC
jgi:SAM-dependent methyltransferase